VNKMPNGAIWRSVEPRRRVLYSEDMTDACVYVFNLPGELLLPVLIQEQRHGLISLSNIGFGFDLSIRELAARIKSVGGYPGTVDFDSSMPDGTPRTLMDATRFHAMERQANAVMASSMVFVHRDFLALTNA